MLPSSGSLSPPLPLSCTWPSAPAHTSHSTCHTGASQHATLLGMPTLCSAKLYIPLPHFWRMYSLCPIKFSCCYKSSPPSLIFIINVYTLGDMCDVFLNTLCTFTSVAVWGGPVSFCRLASICLWNKHPLISPRDSLATCLTGDDEKHASYLLTPTKRVKALHSQLG